MDKRFQQLVDTLSTSSVSVDVLNEIGDYIRQQSDEHLPSFVSHSLQSLISLEHWAWKTLSCGFYDINSPTLFHSLGLFNFKLIFNTNRIDPNSKSSLLIPGNTEWISQIFDNVDSTQDHNDPYLAIINQWFDNLSFFIHENTQFETLPAITYIWQHVGPRYLLTDQYKSYLSQLCQKQIPQSTLTARLLFYIKTCSFMFRMYVCSAVEKVALKGNEVLRRYDHDYLQIISIHSQTVDSWNQELLGCITRLIDFICACCWWGTDKAMFIQCLIESDQQFYEHIEALIHIVGNKSFHERITSQWFNDETILIDSTFIFFIGALGQMKNLSCFIRSETNLSNIILAIAQKSCYDRISVCAYGILAEILSDDQLKEVKITDNISEFFFRILESAWNRPTQRYKRISIPQLLRGFLTVSKNDAIQQRTANSNKITLLIEMSDKYPITLDILWSLSFNSDIQQQLRSNRSFMNKLGRLQEECNNEKMRKIVFGLLWNLESNHQDRPTAEITDQKTFDIMLSYSHLDEVICKQIYEGLVRYGYRVWIDYDQIHGNVMDAMAQAIERSNTILICMSEQYRKSNYCRAEAHYAFQRQLRIVPILLQEHYKPDGWLLFLIGQLLYVDFTKYEFPRAMELLIKELKASNIQEPVALPAQTKPEQNVPCSTSSSSSESSKLPENIHDWTEKDVQNWLTKHRLRQMARLLVDFDGPSLYSLRDFILKTDSKQILTLLQEDCQRQLKETISLVEISRFRALLEKQEESISISCLTKENRSILSLLNSCVLM